jgi:trk system potassium uptake protein TrkA
VVEPDDEVFFIAAREHIRAVTSELREVDKPYHRIMIAGGGNIGATLAERLEKHYQVKVIERSYDRCRMLSDLLEDSIVLHGSGNEPLLLQQENIENTDVFCALTDNDESNIMMSMLAKRLGAKKAITLITNAAYALTSSVKKSTSPSLHSRSRSAACLAREKRRYQCNVHSLSRGAAEAIEVTAHGDALIQSGRGDVWTNCRSRQASP